MTNRPDQRNWFHPRNRHAARYDFPALVRGNPELARFVRRNPAGDDTIDFANPTAVTALNQALLRCDYGIAYWSVPPGYLCPPVPGRADYVHHVADLIGAGVPSAIPRGRGTRVLDIGVGANCIYPIIGVVEYGWQFVGTDIDSAAIAWGRRLVAANPKLAGSIEFRQQPSSRAIFRDIVKDGERFALSMCNPPFHSSRLEAAAAAGRKVRNLRGGGAKPILNFGGMARELWCEGGESGFIRRMIAESAARPAICHWFTTLVSKRDSLPGIYRELRRVRATAVQTIELAHGLKRSRIVAWSFASS